jgi:hypothetical protein
MTIAEEVAAIGFLSVHDAARTLCVHRGVRFEDVGDRRWGHRMANGWRANVRREVWWTLRQVRLCGAPKWSYPEIASVWGNSHATVMESVKKHDRLLARSEAA